MAAARAFAADKRWAAVAAAAPARAPGAGLLGTGPNAANLPSQRGAFTWGNKPVHPASDAQGSSFLSSTKNGGGSGSFSNINDRPSSGGSSRSSTSGSDLLDSPLASGRSSHQLSAANLLSSHNSTTAISRPQSTQSRSGSLQYSHFQNSFSEVLKAPLRTIAKRGPTSQGKGFTLNADDFPVLVSKNSESNSQKGCSSQGQPTSNSVSVSAQDEQRKSPITGGDPVSTTNFLREAQQAELNGTQAPNMCMPSPCLDFWHHPPDRPPDRNGMWNRRAASFGPCKPADTPDSFPVESSTHNGQSLLNQGGEARQNPLPHDCYHPENRDSCYVHVPIDAFVISQPHHILGEVKENHSDTLKKQPVIKKDLVLLEKIKCLNMKARNLRARNMSEISSCRESTVEHPRSTDVKEDHVAKDIPSRSSAVTSDIASAFDRVNSVSESSVPNGPSNMSTNHQILEGHATEFIEARKPGKAADCHVYGGWNTSRNMPHSSAKDLASIIPGHGWDEHCTVDSLPVIMTNTHHGESFPGNSSQQVHVRATDDTPTFPDYEIWHSRSRKLSAQHAEQLQGEERGITQQRAKSIAKLEDMNRNSFVQNQKSNDALIEADKIPCKQKAGDSGTTKHDTSTSDTNCIVDTRNLNMPLTANGEKKTAVCISSTPVSDAAGLSRGPLTPNVKPSAKKTDTGMIENVPQKRVAQYLDTNASKHLPVENKQRQVHSEDRILRERSNIAESTDYIANIAGAPKDTQNAEAKSHVDPSTQNKERRSAFGSENKEASAVDKTHVSGVVINSFIIPVQVKGFTVGSIKLGDLSIASANQEQETVTKVHDTVNSCESSQLTRQPGKNQHGVRNATDPHGNMRAPVEEPGKKERSEAVGLNGTAMPVPTLPSGNQSNVWENEAPTKRSVMKRYAQKPASKELRLQNLRQMLPAENHMTSYDHLSTSKLETKSHHKEALGTSTATKAEVATEHENFEDKKTSWHLEKSSTSWNEANTNGSASAAPNPTEQEADCLVLKVMQELSDQLQQEEKQLMSDIHGASEDCLQPTRKSSLPEKTRKKHRASQNQRQQYVDSQRNVWSNHAANSYMDDEGRIHRLYRRAARPTAHWLPKPISLPQNSALDGRVSEWTWDADEGILISDMDDSQNFSTAAMDRSNDGLTQDFGWGGDLDLKGGQGEGDRAYEDLNPLPQRHRGLGRRQLNPAPHRHGQHDDGRMHLRGGGTGVYFPGRDRDAGWRTDGMDPMAGQNGYRHSEYQPVPAWSSGAAGGQNQGRPAPAWGGAYMEPGYYL
ncbi:hypothetical protein ACP70R_049600 [Stipagrostis hirtigluma subsp. patula]